MRGLSWPSAMMLTMNLAPGDSRGSAALSFFTATDSPGGSKLACTEQQHHIPQAVISRGARATGALSCSIVLSSLTAIDSPGGTKLACTAISTSLRRKYL